MMPARRSLEISPPFFPASLCRGRGRQAADAWSGGRGRQAGCGSCRASGARPGGQAAAGLAREQQLVPGRWCRGQTARTGGREQGVARRIELVVRQWKSGRDQHCCSCRRLAQGHGSQAAVARLAAAGAQLGRRLPGGQLERLPSPSVPRWRWSAWCPPYAPRSPRCRGGWVELGGEAGVGAGEFEAAFMR